MQTIFLTKDDSVSKAFDLLPGITALVGGGGKTTLMLRLAQELSGAGARVIVTTTTHIFPPEDILTCNPADINEAKSVISQNSPVCFGKPSQNEKLITPDLPIDKMEAIADYILVEADGAKRLSLKAPAEHEPVIPASARQVIAVAGLDGAGQMIQEAAFRSARYAALCNRVETDRVTPADIAKVLIHENGQRKGLPPGVSFMILLNKADDETRRKIALEIAAELERDHVERVVITALNKN